MGLSLHRRRDCASFHCLHGNLSDWTLPSSATPLASRSWPAVVLTVEEPMALVHPSCGAPEVKHLRKRLLHPQQQETRGKLSPSRVYGDLFTPAINQCQELHFLLT